jgi:hypothetical protein
LGVRTVIIVPKSKALRPPVLAKRLEEKLGQPVSLQADQVLVDPASPKLDQERAAFEQAQDQQRLRSEGDQVSHLIAVAAGISPEAVILDREARRALAAAQPLPGASLDAYRLLEHRIAAEFPGWSIVLTPPAGLALPLIEFPQGSDQPDDAGRSAAVTAAWAAQRWNWPGLTVPGLADPAPEHPGLLQRRAAAVAAILRGMGMQVVAGKPETPFRLTAAPAGEGGR